MRIGENRAEGIGDKFTAAATPGAAVEFTMDGQAVIGYEGETILEAARRYGAEIPASVPQARLSAGRQLPRLHGGN